MESCPISAGVGLPGGFLWWEKLRNEGELMLGGGLTCAGGNRVGGTANETHPSLEDVTDVSIRAPVGLEFLRILNQAQLHAALFADLCPDTAHRCVPWNQTEIDPVLCHVTLRGSG